MAKWRFVFISHLSHLSRADMFMPQIRVTGGKSEENPRIPREPLASRFARRSDRRLRQGVRAASPSTGARRTGVAEMNPPQVSGESSVAPAFAGRLVHLVIEAPGPGHAGGKRPRPSPCRTRRLTAIGSPRRHDGSYFVDVDHAECAKAFACI